MGCAKHSRPQSRLCPRFLVPHRHIVNAVRRAGLWEEILQRSGASRSRLPRCLLLLARKGSSLVAIGVRMENFDGSVVQKTVRCFSLRLPHQTDHARRTATLLLASRTELATSLCFLQAPAAGTTCRRVAASDASVRSIFRSVQSSASQRPLHPPIRRKYLPRRGQLPSSSQSPLGCRRREARHPAQDP